MSSKNCEMKPIGLFSSRSIVATELASSNSKSDSSSPWAYLSDSNSPESSSDSSCPSPTYNLIHSSIATDLDKSDIMFLGRPRSGTPLIPPAYLKGLGLLDQVVCVAPSKVEVGETHSSSSGSNSPEIGAYWKNRLSSKNKQPLATTGHWSTLHQQGRSPLCSLFSCSCSDG